MPEMRRKNIGWILVYCALVAGTSVCTIQAWTYGTDGFVQLVSNLGWILNLPAWIALYIVHGPGIRTEPIWITLVNAIGWFGWVGGAWVIWGRQSKRKRESEFAPFKINAGRRAFVARSTLGGLGAVAAGAAGYATLIEPWQLKVRNYTVKIEGLDPRLDGFRIAHVSDTHLGPRILTKHIVEAYQMAIDLEPDLIVHTGDHVHDGVDGIDEAAVLCSTMVEAVPLGMVGTLGNHDWWGDGDRLSGALSDVGVRMIDNARVFLSPNRELVSEPVAGALAIVGLGDLTDHEVLVGQAFDGIDPMMPRLVLAHNPDTAEIGELTNADSPRVDLMLSGHTHGGQVRIPFLGTPIVPSRFGQKYAGGLVDGPAFRVLISRGIGMSMLPVRIGVPPEISVITLRA
ncbi:MAG: metallophosphoesterase [Phycisphaerales bacterium]|nr:metallophosphoesterase [Phycisphaerales bacterium]